VIFVDANVFIRHLVSPETSQDMVMAIQARSLFRRVAHGTIEVMTSEATVTEIVFILSAKSHYNVPRNTVVTDLKTLLRPRSFRLTNKAVCLYAFDIWENNVRLSYPDSLAAAYSSRFNYELATFDERLGRLSDIVRYDFSVLEEM
jgi:predicted nucleic acid-binding protein